MAWPRGRAESHGGPQGRQALPAPESSAHRVAEAKGQRALCKGASLPRGREGSPARTDGATLHSEQEEWGCGQERPVGELVPVRGCNPEL